MSATVTSPPSTAVHQAIVAFRAQVEQQLTQRIQRGIDVGELATDTDAGLLAGFYVTVIQGMPVQTRDGAPRDKLAALTGQAWPAPLLA